MIKDNINKDQKLTDTKVWFDNMVENIRYDQLLLETEIIEDEKKKIYDALIAGDQDFLHSYARNASSVFYIKNMVNKYFKELVRYSKNKPNRLALELSNSKIMVWAEIFEDDELMENALILAEAKINSVFSKFGFHISSTIVENSDGLNIPEHYKSVVIS